MPDKVSDPVYKPRFGRTICEVHREMYDLLIEQRDKSSKIADPFFDQMIDRLETTYQMAKKMDAKLRQYKHNYDDGWWEQERAKIVREKLDKRAKRNG